MPRFLLAADGSDHALRAAQTLITMASWLRERPAIHVVHVHQPIPVNIHAAVGTVLDRHAVQDYYNEESRKAVAGIKDALDAAGLDYTTELLVGHAPTMLVQYAKQHNVDLILMGACGLGRVAGAVLGSVSSKVLHEAKRPVLVVH